jgi:hypothetical protein
MYQNGGIGVAIFDANSIFIPPFASVAPMVRFPAHVWPCAAAYKSIVFSSQAMCRRIAICELAASV